MSWWGQALCSLLTVLFAIPPASNAASHTTTVTALVRDGEGRAISSLTKNDFGIADNGDPRPIAGFRYLGPSKELITSRPPEGYIVSNRPMAAFNSSQPTTVLLLDTRDTDPEFQRWQEAQSLRFFTMLRQGEDVAVYQLSRNGMVLLHEFSNDARALSNSILPGALSAERGRPELRPDAIRPVENATAEEFESEGRDSALRAGRYASTCRAVAGLARYLTQFDGRKNLLWISADFPPLGDKVDKQPDATAASCTSMVLALLRANVAAYPVDVRSEIGAEPFNKVPPGHLQAIPGRRKRALSPALVSSVVTLARATGGKAIANRSQLAEAMFDAMEASRSAYELVLDVPDAAWDGKLHKLRVVTSVRDATVTAKAAYFAGDFAGPEERGFDSPGIGLSVLPSGEVDATGAIHMKLFIAGGDVEWQRTADKWRADVDVTVGDGAPEAKRAEISDADNQRLRQALVSIDLIVPMLRGAKSVRISVKDSAGDRAGSVTVPLSSKTP
ncbi:MAG: VWA domain-containing protein [Bryobacteraceae bacterium]